VDPSLLTPNAFTSKLPESQAKDRKSSVHKPELSASSPVPTFHISEKAASYSSIEKWSLKLEGSKKRELFKSKTIPQIITPDIDGCQGLQEREDRAIKPDSKTIELPARMMDLPIPSALNVLVSHYLMLCH